MTLPPARGAQPNSTRLAPPPARSRAPRPAARGDTSKARFEVDRIVLLRLGLAALVLAFLYLVVWIGIRAFGVGGEQQVKRIDRFIEDVTTTAARPPAVDRNPGAAKAQSPSDR